MKKIISSKIQYIMSAIPFIGFVIVFFIGFININRIRKNLSSLIVYFLLFAVIGTVFLLIFALFYMFVIVELNMPWLVIIAVVSQYIIAFCIGMFLVLIQKRLLHSIKRKKEENFNEKTVSKIEKNKIEISHELEEID